MYYPTVTNKVIYDTEPEPRCEFVYFTNDVRIAEEQRGLVLDIRNYDLIYSTITVLNNGRALALVVPYNPDYEKLYQNVANLVGHDRTYFHAKYTPNNGKYAFGKFEFSFSSRRA